MRDRFNRRRLGSPALVHLAREIVRESGSRVRAIRLSAASQWSTYQRGTIKAPSSEDRERQEQKKNQIIKRRTKRAKTSSGKRLKGLSWSSLVRCLPLAGGRLLDPRLVCHFDIVRVENLSHESRIDPARFARSEFFSPGARPRQLYESRGNISSR